MEVNSTSSIDAVQRISSEAPGTEKELKNEEEVLAEEEIQQDMLADGIGQRVDIIA